MSSIAFPPIIRTYRISSGAAPGNLPLGRAAAEDKSLLPKPVMALHRGIAESQILIFGVEKLDSGFFHLHTAGGLVFADGQELKVHIDRKITNDEWQVAAEDKKASKNEHDEWIITPLTKFEESGEFMATIEAAGLTGGKAGWKVVRQDDDDAYTDSPVKVTTLQSKPHDWPTNELFRFTPVQPLPKLL